MQGKRNTKSRRRRKMLDERFVDGKRDSKFKIKEKKRATNVKGRPFFIYILFVLHKSVNTRTLYVCIIFLWHTKIHTYIQISIIRIDVVKFSNPINFNLWSLRLHYDFRMKCEREKKRHSTTIINNNHTMRFTHICVYTHKSTMDDGTTATATPTTIRIRQPYSQSFFLLWL